jgi:hypothetical protein
MDEVVVREMFGEVAEAASPQELRVLMRTNWEAGAMPIGLVERYKVRVRELSAPPQPPVQVAQGVRDLQDQLNVLQEQLNRLMGAQPVAKEPAPPLKRPGKRYRLLDTNVSWSSADQVRAIMSIIEAHVAVGEVFEEDDIVAALEANPHVLQTKQPVKKVWSYYVGNHARGLEEHRNLEKV